MGWHYHEIFRERDVQANVMNRLETVNWPTVSRAGRGMVF